MLEKCRLEVSPAGAKESLEICRTYGAPVATAEVHVPGSAVGDRRFGL